MLMIEQWLWVYAGIEKHALNNTELQVTEHKNGNEGFIKYDWTMTLSLC